MYDDAMDIGEHEEIDSFHVVHFDVASFSKLPITVFIIRAGPWS
jgi:hypothetical protein